MSSLERKISKLDSELSAIDAKLAEASANADTDAVIELAEKRNGVSTEKDALEEEWLELGEQLD